MQINIEAIRVSIADGHEHRTLKRVSGRQDVHPRAHLDAIRDVCVSVRRVARARAWRWGGLMLLALTTPLVLSTLIYYDASWHAPVLNRTMGAFAMFVVALWLVVRTYSRSGEAFEEAPAIRLVATVAANLLAIIALSAQAAGYYDVRIGRELSRAGGAAGSNDFAGRLRDLELAKQLSRLSGRCMPAVYSLPGGCAACNCCGDGAGATLADNAQGVLLGPFFARSRLSDHLIHHARSDPARRFILLPAKPAARLHRRELNKKHSKRVGGQIDWAI